MEQKEDITNINSIPKWMRLDNAATIYPSTITRKYAAIFRLSITLTEKIDKVVLTKALNTVLKRIPSFSYRLRHGLFWYYLTHIEGTPSIQDDVLNPMGRINFKENKHFMFRIRCHGSRISIEIFHALADGMGGMTFLLTLIAEYLRLKYKIKIEYSDMILDPKELPKQEEYEDSFKKVARNIGSLEHDKPAYHMTGTLEEGHLVNLITGTVPIEELKNVSKKYNSTITEFLTSILIDSIQDIQKKDRAKRKRTKPIKISIPVNLRNIYHSKTLRNFSSYVNVGIDSEYGHYSLEEIITQVKNQMGMMITEKNLNAKLTGNVNAEKNKLVRCVPIFIKKYILTIGAKLLGDRYCSSTLSNIGNITLPKSMMEYVTKMGAMAGRSKGNPGAAVCIGYNSNLYITFSRKIRESEIERLFFSKLVDMGIPVEIESNQRR
jgi:NRPS condensation-like uncharacterized protein